MTLELVGLSGYARSGKDTVAAVLGTAGFTKVTITAPLHAALLHIDPLVGPALPISWLIAAEGWETAKDVNPFVRTYLQRLGDVLKDLAGPNVLVDNMLARIPDGEPAVCPNIRTPAEADAIRAAGGQVWRVTRPGKGPANAHITETALDGYRFDVELHNDGTLADLRAQVLRAVPVR